MNLRGPLHHRPGESPLSAEYWVARIDGVAEIVRVRQQLMPDGEMGHVVERFGEPTWPLKGDWVSQHVQFVGSLALT